MVTKKLKNQLKNTAIDTALPREFVSKNSAVTNNGIGPLIQHFIN